MPQHDTPHSLFDDAIEIPAWLEADRDTPYAQRLHRDRLIAGGIDETDPLSRVCTWWQQARSRSSSPSADAQLAQRLARGRGWILVVLIVLAVVVGSGSALAVLRYDGTWPVNVLTALAALVVVQLLLVALTLLLMFPGVPGIRAIQDLLGTLNPASMVASIYRRVGRVSEGSGQLLFWHAARGPAASRFARWQMLVWSQAAAVAFNLSVLATAFALIAFTDLAFGWSTTLRMNAAQVVGLTDAMAVPWRHIWPAAVPTPELVEQSRFYRLASGSPGSVAATQLTGWWPFLLAATITYALLPRCLLLLFATLRLRSATRHLLLDDPRVRALLDRMNTPEIQLGAADAEQLLPGADMRTPSPPVSGAKSAAIVWSTAMPREEVIDWSARHLQRRVSEVFEAGTAQLQDDDVVIERITSLQTPTVLLFVRAWEAPLLDLQDFMRALRTRVGNERSLVMVPVTVDRTPATDEQCATWSRWTAKLGDPALYLESGV